MEEVTKRSSAIDINWVHSTQDSPDSPNMHAMSSRNTRTPPLHVNLVPEPSQDPNDPLNWLPIEKYSSYATICVFSFLATANASNFGVAIIPLAEYFHTSTTTAGYLICFNTLMLGAGNLFWVPLMRVIGKRPVYLMAITLLMVFNIWSYQARSLGSLFCARVLSGFAAAAGDAPVPAVVADMFFAHERGFSMMLFQLALSSGFFIGPLINAFIVQYTGGWQWTCGWIAVAAAANLLIALFTVRESSYCRRDMNAHASSFPARKGMLGHMALFHGVNQDSSFGESFMNIFTLAMYPPLVWAGITVGVFVGWNIVIQLESSVLFLKPPYLWQIHSLGLLALSGLVGTLVAIFIGGKLIDMIANRMTIRNNGHREPEYRLPAMIIPAILGPMGILTFGLCAASKTHWIGLAIGYGMQGFGLTAVSNILATYAVDAYHEAFGQMAAIQYFFVLFAILFYAKGKQIRRWTATYGPLKKLSTNNMLTTTGS
ncbi:hypothetical protein FE257_001474 [Aspergillus nanangensis]|uniref:Major facilitator superfamily (MFS) profile domain-containing protein n=1 Tax=Aspergillus nanangensis TaxID=2582783 RepID=A0AAD4CDM0_ASPNN|nr:hypothetical protein FE257_001474 [Aspergillus nanangensis]